MSSDLYDSIRELRLPDEFYAVISQLNSELRGSELVAKGYDLYKSIYDTSKAAQRGKNGKVFEGLIVYALYLQGIYPIYYQASVTFVPHVIYDILLYHPKNAVVLSCKTSLRERWKQADLEGMALRQVYRGARSILLTLSAAEGKRLQRQVSSGEVLGLDECIVIGGGETRFDELLLTLADTDFETATSIVPVTGKVLAANPNRY